MAGLTVRELLDQGELAVATVAGNVGVSREISAPRIQKPGLALTGWPEQLHPGRVLVLGGTELDYFADHDVATGIATMLASEPACLVVCRGRQPPPALVAACGARDVPLLVSQLVTADFIAAVTAWMADRLAPRAELHGVLMDVLGIGVLVVGKSGIGKSETALDLVVRGHRLVADDVIVIRCLRGQLIGRGAGILGHHMEIRGLGIINVKDLFGISSVREAKKIELVVELHEWDASVEYDRLGFEDHVERLLDIAVPKIQLPVRPGRNLATLIEVAARNQLLKVQGIHSARAFRDRLHRAMSEAEAADAVE
ncbi:MAG TPA: HPr(Ser) kinase/phosphatase [Kofleriaceae bacterium]|nr:HPr(Ser) kinase/phosphatase [Kofleriaceae bacterium]